MTTTKLLPEEKNRGFTLGLAHFAMEVNDRKEVSMITELLRSRGVRIVRTKSNGRRLFRKCRVRCRGELCRDLQPIDLLIAVN
jgi:hypothetical protein